MESKNSKSNLGLKFRFLWMPFLWFGLLAATAATLVHAAAIHLHWPPLDEVWTTLFVPMAFPLLPLYLGLYPRLKQGVRFKPGKEGATTLLVFAWMGTWPFMLTTQHWFAKANERLERVGSIADLRSIGDLSSVELDAYTVALHQGGWSDHVHTTGKYGQTVNLDLFFVAPIGTDPSDTAGTPEAWAVQWFHKSLPSSSGQVAKVKAWDSLVERSRIQLDSGLLGGAVHLRNEARSQHFGHFKDALARCPRYDVNAPLLLLSVHHEPFQGTTAETPLYALMGLAGGGLWWWVVLLFIRVDQEAVRVRIRLAHQVVENTQRFLAFSVPRGSLFVTRILVWVNVIVFLAMVVDGLGFMSMRTSGLLLWGADHGPHTLNGEYWRLLTSTFLHGGLIHLVMNMFGLVLGAIVLEQVLGRWTFLSVYLVCGIAASAASLWWAPDRVSVGASGAVFGLYGVILAFALFRREELADMKFMALLASLFVVYNLVMGMLNSTTDNAAHIGGLGAGFVLGLAFGIVGRFQDPMAASQESRTRRKHR